MYPTLRITTLSNHREVVCIHPREAAIVLSQVKRYFMHGISVQPGDWVVDVGANIGMFSLLASDWGQRPIRGLAIEPTPVLVQALAANLARYPMPTEAGGLRILNCALGQQPGERLLHYYPRATGLSTLFPQELQAPQTSHQVADLFQHLPKNLRWMRHLPRSWRHAIVRLGMAWWLKAEHVPCQVQTLSALIEAHQLPRIDLLKVDVERAELDVLRGIAPHHWPLIRQAVLEVHDTDGRLDAVLGLLRQHGLSDIATESKGATRAFGVWEVWAQRPRTTA